MGKFKEKRRAKKAKLKANLPIDYKKPSKGIVQAGGINFEGGYHMHKVQVDNDDGVITISGGPGSFIIFDDSDTGTITDSYFGNKSSKRPTFEDCFPSQAVKNSWKNPMWTYTGSETLTNAATGLGVPESETLKAFNIRENQWMEISII